MQPRDRVLLEAIRTANGGASAPLRSPVMVILPRAEVMIGAPAMDLGSQCQGGRENSGTAEPR